MGKTFITGDLHGDISRFSKKLFKGQKDMTKEDVMLVTGDFGLIWNGGYKEFRTIEHLADRPFTTAFILGNHENYDIIENLPMDYQFGNYVKKVSDGVYCLLNGNVYIINEKKYFVMGGATSIDKHLRVEGLSWWRKEIPSMHMRSQGILALEAEHFKVDYVLSHTCPSNLIKEVVGTKIGSTDELELYLLIISKLVRFDAWYFGHFHKDLYNIKDKYHCLYENIIEVGSVL